MQLTYRNQLPGQSIFTLQENNALEAETSSTYQAQHKSTNLTAQWVIENGKLICKWIVNQP